MGSGILQQAEGKARADGSQEGNADHATDPKNCKGKKKDEDTAPRIHTS